MTGKFRKIFGKRSILGSQKLLRRKRTILSTKIVFGVLLFVSFVWSVAYISCVPQLTVQNVIVSGNSVIPTDGVVVITQSTLSGKYLGLFSRANFLWYPKKDILNSLRYSYSWLDTVSVKKVNLTTIEIKIKERVPVAVWCGVSRANALPCELMDADGYVFSHAPDFDGPAFLKLYGPLTSADIRGAKFFSKKGLDHINSMTKGLKDLELKPVLVEVSLTSAQEEYVEVLESGTVINVHVDDAVTMILSNLRSLLAQKLFTQSALKGYSNLTNIDMRFGNKIFYKFKDSVSAVTTSTATSSKI